MNFDKLKALNNKTGSMCPASRSVVDRSLYCNGRSVSSAICNGMCFDIASCEILSFWLSVIWLNVPRWVLVMRRKRLWQRNVVCGFSEQSQAEGIKRKADNLCCKKVTARVQPGTLTDTLWAMRRELRLRNTIWSASRVPGANLSKCKGNETNHKHAYILIRIHTHTHPHTHTPTHTQIHSKTLLY